MAGLGTGDQTWELDARNIMFRIDHNFTPNFRANHSFYWNRRPSVRNCEGPDGCNYDANPETESAQNTDYYGNGFFQRISTHHAHQQFDWIIRNNLLNHSTIAWDRWFMGGNHLSAGANWPQRLWQGTANPTGGIVAQDAGPPTMRFNGGSVPYSPIGLEGWPRFGFEKNDRWQFSNDLTWVKGRHTLKTGFEFRHHSYPQQGWGVGGVAGNFNFDRLGTAGYDASGNNLQATGDPFASFLLGQVQSSNQTLPVFPTWRENYTGIWLNDEFKVSNNLTLTLGMRFDYQTAPTERTGSILHLQPDGAEPGLRRVPRRDDLRRRRPRPSRDTEVRGRAERRVGPARRLRLPRQRPRCVPRRLRHLLRARVVQPVRGQPDAGVLLEPLRAEPHERPRACPSPGCGLPGGSDPVPAVHQSGDQSRRVAGGYTSGPV